MGLTRIVIPFLDVGLRAHYITPPAKNCEILGFFPIKLLNKRNDTANGIEFY